MKRRRDKNPYKKLAAILDDIAKQVGPTTRQGYLKLAEEAGLKPNSVYNWRIRGLPRSEWTGETHYLIAFAGRGHSIVSIRTASEEGRRNARR